MKTAALTLLMMVSASAASAQGSYAGQEHREIKELSAAEQADLLAGKGMGFAKTAELNGYPGPRHVLDLAAELRLSPEQKAATETIFARMQSRASALGAQIVAAERALDALFRSGNVSESQLNEMLGQIGRLNAQLRGAHLAAHLEQTKLLSREQVARYNALRGYGQTKETDHPDHAHSH